MKNIKTKYSTNLVRCRTLKNLTSFEMRSQKNVAILQRKNSSLFIKQSRALSVLTFMQASQFLLCFRFLETPATSWSRINSILGTYAHKTVVENFNLDLKRANEVSLIKNPIFQNLSEGNITLVSFTSEQAFTRAIRELILLEDAIDVSAMLSLRFIKDKDSFIDVARRLSGENKAREFYKFWDSKESILLELLSCSLSELTSLTQSFGGEVHLATTYVPACDDND